MCNVLIDGQMKEKYSVLNVSLFHIQNLQSLAFFFFFCVERNHYLGIEAAFLSPSYILHSHLLTFLHHSALSYHFSEIQHKAGKTQNVIQIRSHDINL